VIYGLAVTLLLTARELITPGQGGKVSAMAAAESSFAFPGTVPLCPIRPPISAIGAGVIHWHLPNFAMQISFA
jgi:hypothetical protein